MRELIVFKHDSELGNAPSYKLFDTVKVTRKKEVASARSYQDYEVAVDTQALPGGRVLHPDDLRMDDGDFLMLSELQHFCFCHRQWALIHIEQQWSENLRTVDGQLFHRRAHDEQQTERRGDLLITRGLRVVSHRLGVSGICDVVEFHRAEPGITLFGQEGGWQPYPVEYKKGEPNAFGADELQLCGQALCLEEMLACEIPEGSLFYGETPAQKAGAL